MDPFAPVCSVGDVEGWWKPGGHEPAGGAEEAPSCPRCASPNTKFCYYNNYSLSQPRYFCKACRRYWTKGGSLRNVPVGGGCRKSRRSKAARAASRADPLAGRSDSSSAAGGGFSPDPMAGRDNAGAPDIDMATVFAKFLNQSPGAGDHEVDANVVDQESPNDVEAEPTFAALKDVDPLVFLPCQEIAEKKQLGIQVQDLVGNDGNPLVLPDHLAEGDLERIQHDDGLLWSDTASSDSPPEFTWQLESSFSSDDVWKISSNLMIGDNWNSGFDFSGFEVLSRP